MKLDPFRDRESTTNHVRRLHEVRTKALNGEFDHLFGTPKNPASRKDLLDAIGDSMLAIFGEKKSLSMYVRDAYIRKCGFHIVTKELVQALLPHFKGGKNIVEVMAGTGWFSAHMREVGVDIRPTDDYSWSLFDKAPPSWRETSEDKYIKVDKQDAMSAVKGADIVVMCWPYMDQICERVIESMEPRALLIHNGEPYGCTGTERFWNKVGSDGGGGSDKAVDAAHIQFDGIHDNWYFWRKPK